MAHAEKHQEQRPSKRYHQHHHQRRPGDNVEDYIYGGMLIRDRWMVLDKLGRGGFGAVYEVFDLKRRKLAALKAESVKRRTQVLKMEKQVLLSCRGKPHLCNVYGFGRTEHFNYIIMTLQGRSLSDLRKESREQRFSVGTSLRLTIQALEAVKDLHDVGYLHRDVKPSNFAIGRTTATARRIFMLDFGLARRYVVDGKLRRARPVAGFRGTVRYASINAHRNRELGRHDDLWSLFYMTIEFITGRLPWRKYSDKGAVWRMKEETSMDRLLLGCPVELFAFQSHIASLRYTKPPDYEFLQKIILIALEGQNVNLSSAFEWDSSTICDHSSVSTSAMKMLQTEP